MRGLPSLPLVASLAMMSLTLPTYAAAAERVCDQSESKVTPSPEGRHAASVQHQVCSQDSGRAGAAVTVYVGPPGTPLDGERVAATAVPRSNEEWPRVVWRGESLLEVWVPNLAHVLEVKPRAGDVTVALKYCGDDPAERERVAKHEDDVARWMKEVSAWAERRKVDAAQAGPRPTRPETPRVTRRPCSAGDIPP